MTTSRDQIVFMYHAVVGKGSVIPQTREPGAELYDVDIDHFREQMAFLKENHYEVVTFGDEGKIVLTFDDGEMNNFENAFPVLSEFKFPAYFFVTVKRIGQKGYMDLERLRELRDAGMIIGSHGLHHVILTELKEKALKEELEESKAVLERALMVNIEDFSVPRGFYNQNIVDKIKEAGYKRIFVSERQGMAAEGIIVRIAVKKNWTLSRFKQALSDQIPVEEQATNFVKNMAKKIMGPRTYDKVRSQILRNKP